MKKRMREEKKLKRKQQTEKRANNFNFCSKQKALNFLVEETKIGAASKVAAKKKPGVYTIENQIPPPHFAEIRWLFGRFCTKQQSEPH